MAVELDGNVTMRGDTGPGVRVRVLAENGRLRLVTGNELVGDWTVSDIGIAALQDGFNIKAEGEEFVLHTADDVAFAEELGVTAVSPRLGRRLAVRHNPDEPRVVADEPVEISSNLAAIGFAVAGALIVLGGTFLNVTAPSSIDGQQGLSDVDFWIAFVIGGVVMIAIAFAMSLGVRGARTIAVIALVAMIVTFGLAVSRSQGGTTQLTAYGFIAGGLVVGVAILVSGSLRQPD